MKFTFQPADLTTLKTDVLAALCPEGDKWPEPLRALDEALGGLLSTEAKAERFVGKAGQLFSIHTHGRVGPRRVTLIGGGKRSGARPADLRPFAGQAARNAVGLGAKRLALYVDGPVGENEVQGLVEGVLLGRYRFEEYLSEERRTRDQLAETILAGATRQAGAKAVRRGELVAQAVASARDLVNRPASDMTPRDMADAARKIAKAHDLGLKVLGRRECERLGMGMFLAVARGSAEEPQLIHLHYKPAKAKRRVALVGKGVTFDSGGLSLKPSNAMEDMKIDMSGAATVLGAIGAVAALGLPVEVHAICACAENMPSGTAYKLGDVLRSMAGKTVEINNTDAEGRLTLGDAITYARKQGIDELFDFATLTGACMVALGPHVAGVMSNDDALADRWLGSAQRAGEEMWRLPLPDRLIEQLKSSVADMRNTGERYGGALTAGLFLREFVGEVPWVHVDLAGPAAADKDWGHVAKGGTGFGVSTIVEYLSALS